METSIATPTVETSTPPAMIPINAKVATSGENELDYLKIALDCATNKNGSMNFTKGNGIFNACCQVVKSMRNISKGVRLEENEATKIRTACDLVMKTCLNQVNERNLASSNKQVVVRQGQVVEKITQVGINQLAWEQQIKVAKLQMIPLRELRAKVELAYGDTSLLDGKIDKWQQAILWAEFQLLELAKITKA